MNFFNTWLPFLYLYGVGGLAFLIGMTLIIKTNALDSGKKHHKSWLFTLIIGFFYYAMIHGTFILLAMRG